MGIKWTCGWEVSGIAKWKQSLWRVANVKCESGREVCGGAKWRGSLRWLCGVK